MVGGSLLGQYMSEVDCVEKFTGEVNANTLKVQYINHREFWQALAAWYNQDWSNEEDALLNLDKLLTAGV